MRRVSRLIVGVAAALLAVVPLWPAAATPHPRSAEWWFSAWGIESDVWPVTMGEGVTVAVLDTGVDATVPELSGVVLKGGDTTGAKTDGRKDLDDRNGGHGTGMAAFIAGQGGGRAGFVGIAPKARILPIHSSVRFGDKNNAFESYAAGIRFAVDHDAKVINLSQGVTSVSMKNHCDPDVQNAIGYAIDRDAVVVASAGNTGNTSNWPELPGSCAGVLAVGAFGPNLRAWSGTQRQPYVAVAAPGSHVPSIGKNDQYYPDSSGTSAAAALTSGAIALIRAANPHMPARTVVQRLIATARPLGKGRWNNRTGYGAIQITAAMNPSRYPVAANAPNPVYERFDTWKASIDGTPRQRAIPTNVRAQKQDHRGSSMLPLLIAGVGVVLLATVAFVAVTKSRKRRYESIRETR